MSVLLVGYDLNKPAEDYSGLIGKIKEIGDGWWHYLDSTWLITTSATPAHVRDALISHLDTNDELLVLDVSHDAWATYGVAKSGTDWLHKYL